MFRVKSCLPPAQIKTWLDTRRVNHQCGNCNDCDKMTKTIFFIDITSGKEVMIYNILLQAHQGSMQFSPMELPIQSLIFSFFFFLK